MSEKRKNILGFEIIGFVLSVLYFVAIEDLPYGYYNFLRIASLVLIPIYVYRYLCVSDFNRAINFVTVSSLIVLILFNPIAPVYMDKETWSAIDTISGLFFATSNVVIFLLNLKDTKQK